MSAIHNSARQGDLITFKNLLDSGGTLDERDEGGLSPLHYAAFAGQCEIAKFILDRGFPIDIQDDEGSTPLYFASNSGKTDMVRLLLARGAHVNARNNGHYTALLVACERGHTEVVKALLDHGADVNIMSRTEGVTPMKAAQAGDHLAITSLLANATVSKSSEEHTIESDREALKAYWRKLAQLWWNTRSTLNETVCGKCWQVSILRGEGYFSEIFSELFCESCCERRLAPDRLTTMYQDEATVTRNELRMARELHGIPGKRA
jgi:hypothetical protein